MVVVMAEAMARRVQVAFRRHHERQRLESVGPLIHSSQEREPTLDCFTKAMRFIRALGLSAY